MSTLRLQKMVDKAGGLAMRYRRCPDCGGPITLYDGHPVVRAGHRYMISCKPKDCLIVTARTVAKAIKEWMDAHNERLQSKPKASPRDTATPPERADFLAACGRVGEKMREARA